MVRAGLKAWRMLDGLGLLAITSADRLNAGWQAAERIRQRGTTGAMSNVERLLAPLSRDCGIVAVIDGHPATIAWIGGVNGHRVKALDATRAMLCLGSRSWQPDADHAGRVRDPPRSSTAIERNGLIVRGSIGVPLIGDEPAASPACNVIVSEPTATLRLPCTTETRSRVPRL